MCVCVCVREQAYLVIQLVLESEAGGIVGLQSARVSLDQFCDDLLSFTHGTWRGVYVRERVCVCVCAIL
jgi:hypothetical protein